MKIPKRKILDGTKIFKEYFIFILISIILFIPFLANVIRGDFSLKGLISIVFILVIVYAIYPIINKWRRKRKKTILDKEIPNWLFVAIYTVWIPLAITPIISIIVFPLQIFFWLSDSAFFTYFFGSVLPAGAIFYFLWALFVLYLKKGKVTIGTTILYFLLIEIIVFSIDTAFFLGFDTVEIIFFPNGWLK